MNPKAIALKARIKEETFSTRKLRNEAREKLRAARVSEDPKEIFQLRSDAWELQHAADQHRWDRRCAHLAAAYMHNKTYKQAEQKCRSPHVDIAVCLWDKDMTNAEFETLKACTQRWVATGDTRRKDLEFMAVEQAALDKAQATLTIATLAAVNNPAHLPKLLHAQRDFKAAQEAYDTKKQGLKVTTGLSA